MEKRIDYYNTAPEVIELMKSLEKYTKQSNIDRKLRELMKIRASQINGCAHCLNMHTSDARKMGETEQRIYCLNAFRECNFYSEKEKAALALTEHVTDISVKGVPEDLYKNVRNFFDEKDYVDLIVIINQINTWNRLAISMGNFATANEDE
ncbi:carboxymuconolactone decarboxylase family protein [Virgibacillus sp. MSJ-26]|uniref:carboxymuconolactone decarboxylase family protein n=1 Tax=Virgibacillus sp. MSJ-26 TaxID=2841522 RepID=UPI001C10E683|nr:carboxymuconolactone decarboxylase family protein [Virgibacillus sp. MSJ-26]